MSLNLLNFLLNRKNYGLDSKISSSVITFGGAEHLASKSGLACWFDRENGHYIFQDTTLYPITKEEKLTTVHRNTRRENGHRLD